MAKVYNSLSHGDGYTTMDFSPDGRLCFTGGDDCVVRIWKLKEGQDQEPEVVGDADGAITGVAVGRDFWLSSSTDGQVRRYVKDKGEMEQVVTSVDALQVNSITIDPKGRLLAVSSELNTVKVINLEDTVQIQVLRGFNRGVRKATWHPTDALLMTSGSDGKIEAWDLSGEEPKRVTTIDGVIPAVHDIESPEFRHDCAVVWDPSGDHFFVASRTHDIIQFSRSNWTRLPDKYSDKDVTGAITALAISPNGKYLVSASQGTVLVWSTDSKRVIARQPSSTGQTIMQLAFSPTENIIAWTNTAGGFTRWHDAIPSKYPDPVKKIVRQDTVVAPPRINDDFVNFADDIGLDATPLDIPDDLGAVDDDADMDEDGWIIDDQKDEPDVTIGGSNEFVKEMVSITKSQPPFQPGSTPMQHKKRYLAYNTIGVIEVTDQDTRQLITIDFFDRSVRVGYNFTDSLKFDMGYLGERGALFACPPEGDHPARVLYKPYAPRSNEGDWSYILKRGDLDRSRTRVLGIAAGGVPPSTSLRHSNDELQGFGNVIIATSEGDLTFLSGSGRERRIIALGGDFVSMVAGVDWVFVVYRAGSTTIDGSQNLSYVLINFEDFSVRQRDVLPVPKGHVLKWIGLNDEGAPAMYDSAGRLHILSKYRSPHHAVWTRILDTNFLERREGKDESYWPVGITGNMFMCLILKGRQDHPGFPRPLIQELPLKLPFRRENEAEEKVEREMLFIDMAMDALDDELTSADISARERAMDKEFIKLIGDACKSGNAARAIELSKLLHHSQSIDAAIKVADFFHLVGLKEKLAVLQSIREEEEDRHEIAREKRQRWNHREAPPRRLPNVEEQSSVPKAFQDFGPPPAILRPGLTRAKPSVEPTRFSSVVPTSDLSAWDDSQFEDSSPGSKRKRSDDDFSSQQTDFSTNAPLPKPTPNQKVNPFARKGPLDTNRNPFARKTDNSKILHKSETFFEKVDAAEAGEASKPKKSKGLGTKEKEVKKDLGPRQTTLFGMLPPNQPEKSARGRPKKATPATTETQTQPEPDSMDLDVETQIETQPDASMEDWVETQEVEA